MRHFVLLLLFSIGLAACNEPKEQQQVWVPSDSFNHEVNIAASTVSAKVGEEVILHAERRTTGFVQASFSPGIRTWSRKRPQEIEHEAASNVRWTVEPDTYARFNMQLRKDRARSVYFTKPGTYTIYAKSGAWGPDEAKSNTIEVTVTR